MKTYTEKRFFEWHEDDTSVTLRSRSGSYGGGSEVLVVQTKLVPCVPPIIKGCEKWKRVIEMKENANDLGQVIGVDFYNQTTTGDIAKTLTSIATDSYHIPCVIIKNSRYIVRRLTPTEVERLQAFPDGWTDIGDWVDSKGRTRKTTDSNRYKALGNSICTDAWVTPLERISKILAEDGHTPTMASLFDGIGGFPLVWERINGKGSCVWASEVDDFAIAVTEKRINGKE